MYWNSVLRRACHMAVEAAVLLDEKPGARGTPEIQYNFDSDNPTQYIVGTQLRKWYGIPIHPKQ